MKLLSPSVLLFPVFLAGCWLAACTKPFKSGTGLYSVKQYHAYRVAGSDTTKQGDVKISTTSLDNGYVAWNNLKFHVNYTSDSMVLYINDSLVAGNYEVLHTLRYFPKSDQISVIEMATGSYWRSF